MAKGALQIHPFLAAIPADPLQLHIQLSQFIAPILGIGRRLNGLTDGGLCRCMEKIRLALCPLGHGRFLAHHRGFFLRWSWPHHGMAHHGRSRSWSAWCFDVRRLTVGQLFRRRFTAESCQKSLLRPLLGVFSIGCLPKATA